MFCAGANIRMLASATHAHKVNFCKFTNETRNSIEEASELSDQKYLCVVNGTAAGGGYELALACDHIMLVDDGAAAVSLPELPLLAVLPGTGGLTRVTDKRKVRRDRADVFCTTEEGVKGKRAVEWRLVDEVMPRSRLDEAVAARTQAIAAKASARGGRGIADQGIALTPIERKRTPDANEYKYVSVEFERDNRLATITLRGPDSPAPADAGELAQPRRRVLAPADRTRAGRRHPRHPPQRTRNRHARVQVGRRSAGRARALDGARLLRSTGSRAKSA